MKTYKILYILHKVIVCLTFPGSALCQYHYAFRRYACPMTDTAHKDIHVPQYLNTCTTVFDDEYNTTYGMLGNHINPEPQTKSEIASKLPSHTAFK